LVWQKAQTQVIKATANIPPNLLGTILPSIITSPRWHTERTKAVGEGFGFLKLGLIRGRSGVVYQAVGLVVEAGGRFRERRGKEKNQDNQQRNPDDEFHGHLAAGETNLRSNAMIAKSKNRNNYAQCEQFVGSTKSNSKNLN
jgi:hypothetical protein